MIVLMTDYGYDGPYVGQLHVAIRQQNANIPIVDLIHDLPGYNIRSAAYLLPACTSRLKPGNVIICVVDPGVGSDRPHTLISADGRFFVGPDNGIFDVLMKHSNKSNKFHFDWDSPVSNTFHGRDIYAPVACMIHRAACIENTKFKPVTDPSVGLPADAAEVIYIDSFGNAVTGLRGAKTNGLSLCIRGNQLPRLRTFSDAPEGTCFWYENANGLVEIAANQANAAELLNVEIGDTFTFNS